MSVKAKNRKLVRGYILKTLNISYPRPTLVDSLQTSLIGVPFVDCTDIKPYLEYLQDRGYIKISQYVTDIGLKLDHVKLTSDGVDLLEGTTSDPGVILHVGE